MQRYKLRRAELDKREAELRKTNTATGTPSEDLEKEKINFVKFARRVEKLLSLCFGLLLNLAEDLNIEKKMVKRKIVHLLLDQLDKHSYDLLF